MVRRVGLCVWRVMEKSLPLQFILVGPCVTYSQKVAVPMATIATGGRRITSEERLHQLLVSHMRRVHYHYR